MSQVPWRVAAGAEALTGLSLLAAPAVVVRLLLDAGTDPPGTMFARFCGIALVCLAIACWPRADAGHAAAARLAMWLFQPAAALLLAVAALGVGLRGPLVWPAIACHAVACVVLGRLLAGAPRG